MMLENWKSWSDRVAIESGTEELTYNQLADTVKNVAGWLSLNAAKRIALLADNSPEWIICDLACQLADKLLVPVPPYFSPQQREHLLRESGIELIITDQPELFAEQTTQYSPFKQLVALGRECQEQPLTPEGTAKVTFTSGSTGNPKGVCLSTDSQWRVASSLDNTLQVDYVRHQCLLPLATLLENIAGVYAPLTCGGTVVVSNAKELGFSGARLTNPEAMLIAISKAQPESLIVVPELLMMLTGACAKGWVPPASLKFIAVGGAHVAATIISKARALGLPVYQGYGLSECVSVNTLNTPGQDNLHSVGKTLGHNNLRVDNGELVASGTVFLGYLNNPESFYPTEVFTGDLVNEQDGFFYVEGRRKNLLITSLGRNISPEWIESEIIAAGLFSQVLVVGEARPDCAALLVLRDPETPAVAIENVIDAINQQLPEYARIRAWQVLSASAITPDLFTTNGKLKRDIATQAFTQQIETMYAVAAA